MDACKRAIEELAPLLKDLQEYQKRYPQFDISGDIKELEAELALLKKDLASPEVGNREGIE